MAFRYLDNMPLEQAQQAYLTFLHSHGFAAETEEIAVQEAAGRISSCPVYAAISSPHYTASAMDGIALQARSTFGATETTPVVLSSDEYHIVDTGDPIPAWCDAVIMVEDVVWLNDGAVKLYASAAPWQHVRQVGEDICAGEMLLPAYTKISPSAIGALIAGGIGRVPVLRQLVVAILPTGDEIVAPNSHPKPGDIPEFNSAIFSAMLIQWGVVPKVYPIQPDRFETLCNSVKDALATCDMVIINAGSSAGREDFTEDVIRSVGEMQCHGIAIKPGKPTVLGCCGPKPLIGVPGYPVSGILVLEQVIKPVIDLWYHQAAEEAPHCQAILSRAVVSGLKYKEFVRVRIGKVGQQMVASPLSRGSGVVSSFMKADGILEIPQGVEGYEAGSSVKIRLLRPLQTLIHTVVAIGSHDPLLDEIGNLLHIAAPELSMSSSHVGSMGGIMAVRRGEAHLAGIHLLNQADGQYNVAFIKRYFPNGGVRLVECVGRTQGLMLQKGNPKSIHNIYDLTKPDIRYVNRQKGSGTRILIDYLCQKEKIDVNSIYGYDREEFTHMSVAAQIAADTADAGMGIYSAAQIYQLEFLPICTERYDLLIPDSAWNLPEIQQLLEILRSDAFRQRAEELGGYLLENPGSVCKEF